MKQAPKSIGRIPVVGKLNKADTSEPERFRYNPNSPASQRLVAKLGLAKVLEIHARNNPDEETKNPGS